MNLGDLSLHASNKAINEGDKRLFQRIINGGKSNFSVRKAYGAFVNLSEAKTKSREMALHFIKENISNIDPDEYSDFMESLSADAEGIEETDLNMALHEAIVRPAGSIEYLEAMEYLVESIMEEEEMCEECDEEYDSLSEEDKAFLEELAEADDDKKKLMFDDLKAKAMEEAEKDIKDAINSEDAIDIAEAVVRIGRMRLSEENIISLYEFCNKP